MIEKYIEFAIENGLTISCIDWEKRWVEPTLKLITSKLFIEAIARGINEETFFIDNRLFNYLWAVWKITTVDSITMQQSLAIRDNKLEGFIKSLIK